VIKLPWSRPGRDGGQREHRGRNGLIEVLTGTTNGVVYTVSVQGCNKRSPILEMHRLERGDGKGRHPADLKLVTSSRTSYEERCDSFSQISHSSGVSRHQNRKNNPRS
jgi:hypothetical protein